jgi:hypothetical protein
VTCSHLTGIRWHQCRGVGPRLCRPGVGCHVNVKSGTSCAAAIPPRVTREPVLQQSPTWHEPAPWLHLQGAAAAVGSSRRPASSLQQHSGASSGVARFTSPEVSAGAQKLPHHAQVDLVAVSAVVFMLGRRHKPTLAEQYEHADAVETIASCCWVSPLHTLSMPVLPACCHKRSTAIDTSSDHHGATAKRFKCLPAWQHLL